MDIVGLVSNAASAVAAVFNWKSLPERRRAAAAKALAKEQAAAAAGSASVSDAVYGGDKDAVNQAIGKTLRVIVIGALFGVCSCARTVTQYVPADRAVVPDTREGVAGWFVPNATMDDLLKRAQRAADLEKEKAVTARMDGKQ